jgi:hypothetical protein
LARYVPATGQFWPGEEPFRVFYGVERIIVDAKGNKVAEVRASGVQQLDDSLHPDELGLEQYVHASEFILAHRGASLPARYSRLPTSSTSGPRDEPGHLGTWVNGIAAVLPGWMFWVLVGLLLMLIAGG